MSTTAILRGICAAFLAAVISTVGFLLLGVALPMWSMMLIYGRQAVQDAPAHGGVIFLLTVPIAGLLALCGFLILTAIMYRRLSINRGN
jgi:hypothetical protein